MSNLRTIQLTPEPVTAEAFAPFGVLPPDEGDGKQTADLEFTLDDGWVNYIEHTLDEIEVVERRVPLRAAEPARYAHADLDADERSRGDRRRTRRGRLHRRRAPRHRRGVPRCRSTRACTCFAARGIGVRIPSARPRSGSSTCRAGAIRTTTPWCDSRRISVWPTTSNARSSVNARAGSCGPRARRQGRRRHRGRIGDREGDGDRVRERRCSRRHHRS